MPKSKPVILFLACLFIPYILLCHYAYPAADDFSYTAGSPFWLSQLNLLKYWNGRYTANFFIMVNPTIYHSLFCYRLVSLFLLLLIPLSFYFLFAVIAGRVINGFQRIVASLIVSSLILGLLPSLPEGIYWYTGSVTYILGSVAATLYASFAIMYFTGKIVGGKWFHLLLCMALLIIAIGFNEVQMLILLFAQIFIWVLSSFGGQSSKGNRLHRKIFSSPQFVLMVCCIIFSTVVIMSPGNHYRGSYFNNNYRPFYSLGMTAMQMVRFFSIFISYSPLLLAGILFIPISTRLTTDVPLFEKLGKISPITWFVMLAALLFLCIYPAYWGTGILGQHRTVNTACYYFVPLWFLFLQSLFVKYRIREKIVPLFTQNMLPYLTLFLALLIMISGNSGTVLFEFGSGKITGFDREMKSRNAMIMHAAENRQSTVSVPPLMNKPRSIFVLDFQPDCNHWINKIEAHYYGLDMICLDSARVPK